MSVRILPFFPKLKSSPNYSAAWASDAGAATSRATERVGEWATGVTPPAVAENARQIGETVSEWGKQAGSKAKEASDMAKASLERATASASSWWGAVSGAVWDGLGPRAGDAGATTTAQQPQGEVGVPGGTARAHDVAE